MAGYSITELADFKQLIQDKLNAAAREVESLSESLMQLSTSDDRASLENFMEVNELEHIYQLLARQRKFILQLKAALYGIENRTYGICSVSGEKIPRERLLAVPHTTMTLESKQGLPNLHRA